MRVIRSLVFCGLALLAAVPAAASTLFALETNNNRLIRIDTLTGAVTDIGALPSFSFGGLDFDASGNLYALLDNNLYSVNPNTAASVLIGSAPGRTLESFEIIGGSGYTADVFNESLYSVDLATGAVTLIGSHNEGATDDRVTGLASIGGDLYGVRFARLDLVRLSLVTGAATLVGSHGLGSATSLAFADGVFWTLPATTGNLYRLDPLTGAATLVHSGIAGHITGLTALQEVIPEPLSLLLVGSGLAGIVRARRSRA